MEESKEEAEEADGVEKNKEEEPEEELFQQGLLGCSMNMKLRLIKANWQREIIVITMTLQAKEKLKSKSNSTINIYQV